MLYPIPADPVDPVVAYDDMPVVQGRPSVRLNMIVSVDGGTSWNGVSGALGGAADKQLFGILRSLADMILVASGTMRAEHYGPVVAPPGREAAGIAVVSMSCDFDLSSPFFQAATKRPIILTVESADADRRKQAAEVADVVIAGDDSVDMKIAVQELGARGAKHILAEGGPTLNGELAQAMLLDELCVTLSPTLASGDSKRLLAGSTLEMLARLQLHMICEADDYLFLRYRRAP
jgi:riboflavin biosynthesis pyrimidine reductase